MFPVGFAITLGGVAILTLRSRKNTRDHEHLHETGDAVTDGSPIPPHLHPVGGRSDATPVHGRHSTRGSPHSSSRATTGAGFSWTAPSHHAAVNGTAAAGSSASSSMLPKSSESTASPSVRIPHFHTDDTASPISEEQNQV